MAIRCEHGEQGQAEEITKQRHPDYNNNTGRVRGGVDEGKDTNQGWMERSSRRDDGRLDVCIPTLLGCTLPGAWYIPVNFMIKGWAAL